MKKIQECCFELGERVDITLPKESKILSVQECNHNMRLFALVDDEETETEVKHLRLFKSGCQIHDNEFMDLRYICSLVRDSSQDSQDSLHIFEYEEFDQKRLLHTR
jgi:hypothetical protein